MPQTNHDRMAAAIASVGVHEPVISKMTGFSLCHHRLIVIRPDTSFED